MKKTCKLLSILWCAVTAFSVSACGGETVPPGSKVIKFWYEADSATNRVYYELVKTYNDGQGVEDKVYVQPSLMSDVAYIRNTYETSCEASVLLIDDKPFKDFAKDGLFLNMSSYLQNDAGTYDESKIPANLRDRFKLTIGGAGQKTIAGAGQDTYALPFGDDPNMVFYNKDHFAQQNINIISVSEEELPTYNAQNGTSYMPHGYAEYALSAAPAQGLTSSQNLAGQTVYKVFNNRIAMNWEEFRYLSKCFTESYNASSPSEYGFVSEWWFAYCWSVGGDCIGFDGEKYNFTLGDESANYLVTKDNVKVHNTTYRKGEIVTYEDKVNQSGIADIDGLYPLPSQRTALSEFLKASNTAGAEIDTNESGYGIMPPDFDRLGNFVNKKVTMMIDGYATQISALSRAMSGKFDITFQPQYRKYKGGSTYYQGGTGFANEYLKVIGTDSYTGELETDGDNTPIVGSRVSASIASALVIPAKSPADLHEAAWKFVRWAASEAGQAIMAKADRYTPNQTTDAVRNAFMSGSALNKWAALEVAKNTDIGDWSYFENGEWVNGWSDDFNYKLRKGTETFTTFMNDNYDSANAACANTSIIIKGRRR